MQPFSHLLTALTASVATWIAFRQEGAASQLTCPAAVDQEGTEVSSAYEGQVWSLASRVQDYIKATEDEIAHHAVLLSGGLFVALAALCFLAWILVFCFHRLRSLFGLGPPKTLQRPWQLRKLSAVGPSPRRSRQDFRRWRCAISPATAGDPKVTKPFATLTLKIVKAKGLPQSDTNRLSDPYAVALMNCKDMLFRTKTVSRTLTPVWDQEFVGIEVFHPSSVCTLKVFDEDYVSMFGSAGRVFGLGDDFLGYVDIQLGVLPHNRKIQGWLPLRPAEAFVPGSVSQRARLGYAAVRPGNAASPTGEIFVALTLHVADPNDEFYAFLLGPAPIGHNLPPLDIPGSYVKALKVWTLLHQGVPAVKGFVRQSVRALDAAGTIPFFGIIYFIWRPTLALPILGNMLGILTILHILLDWRCQRPLPGHSSAAWMPEAAGEYKRTSTCQEHPLVDELSSQSDQDALGEYQRLAVLTKLVPCTVELPLRMAQKYFSLVFDVMQRYQANFVCKCVLSGLISFSFMCVSLLLLLYEDWQLTLMQAAVTLLVLYIAVRRSLVGRFLRASRAWRRSTKLRCPKEDTGVVTLSPDDALCLSTVGRRPPRFADSNLGPRAAEPAERPLPPRWMGCCPRFVLGETA